MPLSVGTRARDAIENAPHPQTSPETQYPALRNGFIVKALVARKHPAPQPRPHRLKLEDVFLRLTKGIVQ